jgi:hypothetical protein
LNDPVYGSRRGAQDFENDDGIGNHSAGAPARPTGHEPVWIADVVVASANLEVAAVELAGSAAQAGANRNGQVGLNGRVGACAAGHCESAQAVEFVAKRLALLPGEEVGQSRGVVEGDAHRSCAYIMDPEPAQRANIMARILPDSAQKTS